MELVNTLMLTGAILLSDSYDNSKEKAIKTLALYEYKTLGMETQVKKYTRKLLPDEMRNYTGILVASYSILVNNRIEVRWTF